MGECIDLTGQKFGLLTVIKREENTNTGNSRWLCKCECGEEDPNYVAPEEPKKKCGKKSADVVIAAIALTAGISIIFRKKD